MKLTLLAVLLCAHAPEPRAVFSRTCLTLNSDAFAEAPLHNGEPDFSQVKLHGLKIDKSCGVIQVGK